MQIIDIYSNELAVSIVPGPVTDSAAGIDPTTALRLSGELGAPGLVPSSGGLRQVLAMGIRTVNTTQIASVT